ncbi:MAG: RimK family protein [Bdellovibrionales bacterium]|nr:RimK family protein [Bdellovibrionales bacterium]
MKNIVVLDEKIKEKINSDKFEVMTPMQYILHSEGEGRFAVYNMSSKLGYQDSGYYVSLLARARNDKIYPSPRIIQDLKDKRIRKIISDYLDDLFQTKFKAIKGDEFVLTSVLGKNVSDKYNVICWEFFRILQAPLFKIFFKKGKKWNIEKIKIVSPDALSPVLFDYFCFRLNEYFENYTVFKKAKSKFRYDLAILHNSQEPMPPSNEKALEKFIKAAKKLEIRADLVEYKDRINIPEFDALFIRETTFVTHHTYRLARWAESERLFVIDSADSILKCSNKIYLEQMLSQHNIAKPKSLVVDRSLLSKNIEKLNFPCILKKPDSAFSLGVFKVSSPKELLNLSDKLFKDTELLLIQEFLKTDFDWRVGVLGGEVIFVCKYYMANNHWQIIDNESNGKDKEGEHESVPVAEADPKLIRFALHATNKIGNGLYGVDIKQKGDKYYLIEINDNPNIDAGVEDEILGEDLYLKIMNYFLNGIQKYKGVLND